MVGGIKCDEEKPWCSTGERIAAADLQALETSLTVIRGAMVDDLLELSKSAVALYEISPGQRKGWAYAWNANACRWKGKVCHKFWVFLFRQSSEPGFLDCVASTNSPQFDVCSSKRSTADLQGSKLQGPKTSVSPSGSKRSKQNSSAKTTTTATYTKAMQMGGQSSADDIKPLLAQQQQKIPSRLQLLQLEQTLQQMPQVSAPKTKDSLQATTQRCVWQDHHQIEQIHRSARDFDSQFYHQVPQQICEKEQTQHQADESNQHFFDLQMLQLQQQQQLPQENEFVFTTPRTGAESAASKKVTTQLPSTPLRATKRARNSSDEVGSSQVLGILLSSFEALDLEQKTLQRMLDDPGMDEMDGVDETCGMENKGQDMRFGEDSEPWSLSALPTNFTGTHESKDDLIRSGTPSAIYRFFYDNFFTKQQSQFDSANYKQEMQQQFCTPSHTLTLKAALTMKQPSAEVKAKLHQLVGEFATVVAKYVPNIVAEVRVKHPALQAGTDTFSRGSSSDDDLFFDAETRSSSEDEIMDSIETSSSSTSTADAMKSNCLMAFLAEIVVNGLYGHFGGTVTAIQTDYAGNCAEAVGFGSLADSLFFDPVPKEASELPLLFSPAVLKEKCANFSGVWNHDQKKWEEFQSLLNFEGSSWVVQDLTANSWKQIQVDVTHNQIKLALKPGFSMRAVWSCTFGCPLEATGQWGKWTKVVCKTTDQMCRAKWCGGKIFIQTQPPKISPIYRELAKRMLPELLEMKGRGHRYMRTWVIGSNEETKAMEVSMVWTPLNGTNWDEWDTSVVCAKADLLYTKMQNIF
jgi:hypothetical protein